MPTIDIATEVRARRRLPTPSMRRAIRESAGVSQLRVASSLGVTRMTVSRWESGIREPRGEHLVSYVALLDELVDLTRDAS